MFTSEVIEQLQYYLYRLIDPRIGQTFYVGKGKENRVYAHINDALKNFDGHSYENNEEDEISEKIKQIREIKAAGFEVIHFNLSGEYLLNAVINGTKLDKNKYCTNEKCKTIFPDDFDPKEYQMIEVDINGKTISES